MATPHNYCRAIAPQIFCQIVQIERRQADACQAKVVQYDEKDASKRAAKVPAVNCVVLPYIFMRGRCGSVSGSIQKISSQDV